MSVKITIDEAMDIVDIYGPDPIFWPSEHTAALNRYIANEQDFRDYVDDAKWLESMLENWDEADGGAEIDLDDLNFDSKGNSAPEHDEDDDQDEDDNDAGMGHAEADEDGSTDDMDGGGDGSSDGAGHSGMESEEGPIVIDLSDLDPDQMKDVDQMLAEVIKAQLDNADPTEFRVFTRDFDEITDIKVPDHVSLERIDKNVAKATGPLQKDLRRMIASRSQVKRIPGMRSGRLHAPNLHRILAGDDRVFTRREEAASLDTAITLLIDASGSMNGSRMTLATETAYALGQVLHRLNIAFECLGFTDNYGDERIHDKQYQKEVAEADAAAKITRAIPIIMPKFKTFDERWQPAVQRRFAHVVNMDGYSGQCGFEMGSTPEGCGLEFAARRLLARKEKRKILISMTDGSPGGHVYNPTSSSDHYAYQNQSIKMVQAIEAAGVDLVGVGIQHNGPAAYYSNHLTINSVEEMPKRLLGVLKSLLV